MISPQYVDGLELRIKELEAQLADTEKERDEWKDSAINGGNAAYLREQLAELKKQEPVAWMHWFKYYDGTDVVRVAIGHCPKYNDQDPFRSEPLFAAPVVQPDMVTVPREPTEAMIDAAMNRYKHVSPEAMDRYTKMHRENFRCDYKAMIAAAEGKSNAVAHREAACGRSGGAEC